MLHGLRQSLCWSSIDRSAVEPLPWVIFSGLGPITKVVHSTRGYLPRLQKTPVSSRLELQSHPTDEIHASIAHHNRIDIGTFLHTTLLYSLDDDFGSTLFHAQYESPQILAWLVQIRCAFYLDICVEGKLLHGNAGPDLRARVSCTIPNVTSGR